VKLTSKIHIVYYGYDNKRFPIKKVKQFGKDKYSIGTLARLTRQKDIETLLHGFSIALKTKNDMQLIIAGDGELKESLRKLAISLDISSNISWLGKITETEGFLASLDAFVLTSKYEGFGLVLLEAMQANLPIIAAKNSAIPEVLGEDYSYLFETSNPVSLSENILRLANLDDPHDIEKYLKKRLRIFNPEKMENKINKLYESILVS
jgi:glycosyltransferase involved in cell wall biosynthesis